MSKINTLPRVIEQCEIDNAILIGHGDGGSIALLYAGLYPEKVRGIIIEAAHVFVEQKTISGIREALAAFDVPQLRNRLLKYHGIHTETILQDWEEIWLHPDFFNWNIKLSLPQITAPTLVIQGEDDPYGTLSQVDAIVEQVSGPVESLIIPECAHTPHLQAKQLVLERMSLFIKNVLEMKIKKVSSLS
jgi:pimeloyl-ACP methyl ester carboxylesterase